MSDANTIPEGVSSVVKIGNKFIGEKQPAFFIAEIGANHNGDYFLAKKSIEEAFKAGADAVKLQKRFMDDVFTKEMQDQPQLKDQIFGKTYGEYRRNLELNEDEFRSLKNYCDELGIIFFATPFDKKSADFLENIGVELYKVASFDATNTALLEHVAKKGKPVILSLGMTTAEETDLAVQTILKFNNQLVILHCISVYPTPDEKLNLTTINYLKERYAPLPVGYSGHEKDYLPTLGAISLGAKCVERHFTIDKKLPGPDHATVSLEPAEFKQMVDGARRLELAMGQPQKVLHEEEKKARAKHSKSIVAKEAIPAGTPITYENITFKSPGHGFKPYMIDKIVGLRVKIEVPADSVITIEHIDVPQNNSISG